MKQPEQCIVIAAYNWTGKIAHAAKRRENRITLSFFRNKNFI